MIPAGYQWGLFAPDLDPAECHSAGSEGELLGKSQSLASFQYARPSWNAWSHVIPTQPCSETIPIGQD